MNNLKDDFGGDSLFELIMFLPDSAVYIFRLLADNTVSKEYKVELALCLFYIFSPIDFIPELLIEHPIALMDDAAVAIRTIKLGFDEKYISSDQNKKYWPGDIDLVHKIDEWDKAISKVLGDKFIIQIWEYLRQKATAPS
ncbi:MAG: DUF1232 domain-containing protein [Deltaproteobacteria bacterium]|nr:DUF1232 domain-containing protein [Deltaproteobacteria bacterium]